MSDSAIPSPPELPAAGVANIRPLAAAGCFLLLLIGLHLAVGQWLRLTEWRVRPESNTNFAEALAWRHGRLDLPARIHDSALYNGRIYSVNPPLFSFLSYAALLLGEHT